MYMTCTDLITDRTSSNQLSANSSTDQLCPIFDSNTDGYTVPTTDIFSTTIVTDRQQLNILRVLDPDLSPNLQQQKETAAAAGRRKASKPLKGSESTAYQRQLREQQESRQDNTDFEVLSRTCRLITFIFDTGASTTIVDVDLNKYLSNVSRSNVSISGFHGSTSVDGDKYGTLHCFPLSDTEQLPIKITCDTAPGVNQPLCSFTKFYETLDYNLQIVQHDDRFPDNHNLNFVGMYKRDHDNPDIWTDKIPFTYDSAKSQWILELAVGVNDTDAKKFGAVVSRIRDRRMTPFASAHFIDADCQSISFDDIPLVQALLAPVNTRISELEALMSTADTADDIDEGDPRSLNLGKFASMSAKQLHEFLGHYGHLPGCLHCMQVKKSLNRIFKNPRPKHDPRPGHTWDCDICYWSFTGISRRGFKYTLIMKCRCTGVIFVINLCTRDEVSEAMFEFISQLRADPRFAQDGYPIFNRLHLDLAGEFLGNAFKDMLKRLDIHEVHYSDPNRKEDHGHAEFAVKQIELQTKKQMAMTSSPVEFFCYHVEHAAKVISRLPLKRNIHSMSGDAIRPLEQLTMFAKKDCISRRDCDNDLLHMEVPCQLALINDKSTKGSDIDRISRCSWAFVLGTKDILTGAHAATNPGHLTLFETFLGTQRSSKSFTILRLAEGQNAWSTMGKTPPGPLAESALRRQGDDNFPAVTIIKLPFVIEPMVPNPSILGLQMHNTPLHGQPAVKMFDMLGRILLTDPTTDELRTGQLALPDILEQLGIGEQNSVEYHSSEYQRQLLQSPTHCKQFIGRSVYQYFEVDTEPPGKYEGKIVSHHHSPNDGNLWRVVFPAIGNNNQCTVDYDEDEMMDYCIDADATGVITADNITMLIKDAEAKYLPLSDFQTISTRNGDTFAKICDRMLIPKCDRHIYYDWTCSIFGYGPANSDHPDAVLFDSPFVDSESNKLKSNGPKFKAKTLFPIPSGASWLDIKLKYDKQSTYANPAFVNSRTCATVLQAEAESCRLKYKDTSPLQNFGGCIPNSWHEREAKEHNDLQSILLSTPEGVQEKTHVNFVRCLLDTTVPIWESAMALSAEDKSELADLISKHVPHNPYVNASGKIQPPTSLSNAMTRSDWPLWEFGYRQELKSFADLKVHSAPMTLSQCRALGKHMSPVRSHWIFDSKYCIKTEVFLKSKGRWVIDGTTRAMRYNEHFWESFSPAPNPIATRIMQSVACGYDKKRYAADVEVAFLKSLLKPHEQIIVRLPDGQETTNADGELCRYVILYRGQYGTKCAAFYWSRTRDAWLLDKFSAEPYTIRQLDIEKCLFVITNTVTGAVTHLLIHVDDIDCIADDDADAQYIFGQMHLEWGIKMTDPDMMLGIQRRLTTVDGVRYLEMIMPTYITDMYNEWSAVMAQRSKPIKKSLPSTPFPDGEQLSVIGTERFPKPPDAEIAAVTPDMQKFTGQLLWVARMIMPDCLFASSQFGRVVTSGSTKVLDECAMHTLRYLYSQRDRGIRFRSDGCRSIRALYDASDNPDPKDGKSQYGYSVMLFDGPICAVSKKTTRVGTSSTHNEFIAQSELAKTCVYIQDLLTQMGFPECCDGPVPAGGDNVTATSQLSQERITERNRFYLTDLHFLREIFELGRFMPYWIHGAVNGAGVRQKGRTVQGHGGVQGRGTGPHWER